jgi:peroxiredoxin
MSLLKVGDKIPEFSCYDDKENLITNKDLEGKKNNYIFLP